MVGFKVESDIVYGPCARYTSTVSVLDPYDCHTITGPPQHTNQKEYEWKAWRLCGGNDQNLYLLTEVHIIKNDDGSWDYRSATCCRVTIP